MHRGEHTSGVEYLSDRSTRLALENRGYRSRGKINLGDSRPVGLRLNYVQDDSST